MEIRKTALYILCLILVLASCSKNDDDGTIVIEIRDRTEQQIVDKDSLIGYLETHYYNSGDFITNTNQVIGDIIISELPDDGVLPDPVNNTLLIDAVEIKNALYVDVDEEVDYEYYVLKLNQGGGTSPNFPDKVRVNYSGNLMDEEIFDSTANPTSFDLLNLIPGWGRVLSDFNSAESHDEVGDGTVSFLNYGLGVMFLPSGLAFYAGGSGGVPVYSNVIFKFELMQTEINDHDGDGIPTYLEDLNNDLNLSNDDTDADQFSNFVDLDDDNDETLTIDEVEFGEHIVDTNMGDPEPVLASNEFETQRTEEDGIITISTVIIIDSNSDNTPDYLDSDVN